MTVGLAPAVANALWNALYNDTDPTSVLQVTTPWIQLHDGDPGAAGTTNVAGNATRKQVSMGAASGGAVTNDSSIAWAASEVDTAEDYTHWSIWDASSSGNFKQSGTMTANSVAVSDTFTIASSDLDMSATVAA